MVRKEEVPPHIVIPDTNILWYKEKSVAVNPEFDSFWNEFSATSNLELVIPDVVKGELLFQQSSSAIKLMNKASDCFTEISSITNYKYNHKITTNRVKKQVETRFDKWIKTKKATIEPAPTSNIDWNSLINNAIWREPPFESDAKNTGNEKGFRDSIILETVVEYCRHDEGEKLIAFICNDFLLRTTAEKRMKHDNRFSAFESIEDFESYLKLQHEKLTDKFIKSLLKKASVKFFKSGDESCLSRQGNLIKQIENKYKDYTNNPSLSEKHVGLFDLTPSSTSWSPTKNGQYWIANTQFKKITANNIYHWSTEVTFVRQYFHQPKGLMDLAIPEKSKVLILPFVVSWTAKVTRDGKFRDSAISDIEIEGNKFVTVTDEYSKRWGLS